MTCLWFPFVCQSLLNSAWQKPQGLKTLCSDFTYACDKNSNRCTVRMFQRLRSALLYAINFQLSLRSLLLSSPFSQTRKDPEDNRGGISCFSVTTGTAEPGLELGQSVSGTHHRFTHPLHRQPLGKEVANRLEEWCYLSLQGNTE